MFHVFTFHFFLNIVNRAEGIWSSDNYSDVRLNLKRNEMLSSLTWKTLARKNLKKQSRLLFRLKALFLLNMYYIYIYIFKTFRFSVRLKNHLEFTSKLYEIKHMVSFRNRCWTFFQRAQFQVRLLTIHLHSISLLF